MTEPLSSIPDLIGQIRRERDDARAEADNMAIRLNDAIAERNSILSGYAKTIDELRAFLARVRDGGSIVSSGSCSEAEIIVARCCGRFYAGPDLFGYVYRPPAPDGHELYEVST